MVGGVLGCCLNINKTRSLFVPHTERKDIKREATSVRYKPPRKS